MDSHDQFIGQHVSRTIAIHADVSTCFLQLGPKADLQARSHYPTCNNIESCRSTFERMELSDQSTFVQDWVEQGKMTDKQMDTIDGFLANYYNDM